MTPGGVPTGPAGLGVAPPASALTMPPASLAGVPMSSVISRIEGELREIWSVPTKPGELVKSRVCTMNLVVVARTRELAQRYAPIVDEVTASIPARAIVVALEPEAPSATLEGEATAVCSVAQGSQGALCSERITLVATGNTCARVGSAVEALLVPEIPTTLVWLGRVHADDPVFLSIASDAQRIVLDTEYTSLTSLMKLARWTRAEVGRAALADLAWTRLSVWQELSARFFDSPEMRPYASGVTRVVLRQASEKGARLGAEGSLFLGWLATRLEWKAERLGGAVKFRRPDGGQVTLTLEAVPRPKEEAPGALTYVGIVATANNIVAKGSIERELGTGLEGQTADADVLRWKLDVALPTACEQRIRLYANKGAGLLIDTLHRAVEDPALGESIAFAEQLSEDELACN
jgi:glucose-6-phosphate dehydrogenase assembly protein OpcA